MTDEEKRRLAEAELQAIAAANGGRLTAEMVVEAARDEASPLHDFFQWDDAAAAAEHRIAQARALIRSVRVVFRTEKVEVRAPYFIRDPEMPPSEQGYVSLPQLRTDEDAARAAIASEFARAAAALQRARSIAVALGLEEEVTELADRLGMLRAAVAHGGGAVAAAA
jgi:hypothetical protein